MVGEVLMNTSVNRWVKLFYFDSSLVCHVRLALPSPGSEVTKQSDKTECPQGHNMPKKCEQADCH